MQNTPNFAELPDSIRSIMKSSIEQARKAFDTFVASSEKMMQSVDTSSVPAADGLKQLNEKIAHFTRRRVDVYTDAKTAKTVLTRFAYCFVQPEGSGYPAIANMHTITEPFAPFWIGGAGGPLPILAFLQRHGDVHSLGFRFGPIAYSPDVNALNDEAFETLEGVNTWIVDALRYTPHPSHAHVALALEWIGRVKPRHAVLTNLHQDLDYDVLKSSLPANVEPAYDGQTVTAGL